MMHLCILVPQGSLRNQDNTDCTAKNACIAHSLILASMARIRWHVKPLLCEYICVCVCVCVSLLGFHAPLTMGRPPAGPYVLITPGACRRQCFTVYVTRI